MGAGNSQNVDEDKVQAAEWAYRLGHQRFFADNSPEKENKWGYDLYPERRKNLEPSFLTDARDRNLSKKAFDRQRCESNVYRCFQTSHLVRLMAGALASAGW